jgi:Ca2+/Na+ antiporter
MKIYHKKAEIDDMTRSELKELHKSYVIYIIGILAVGGIVSLLSIWDYISSIWRYLMLVFLAILWPWIMQSSYMARKLRENKAGD